jgi:hypothetical protein
MPTSSLLSCMITSVIGHDLSNSKADSNEIAGAGSWNAGGRWVASPGPEAPAGNLRICEVVPVACPM